MMREAQRRHIASLDILRVGSMLYIVGFWHLMNYAVAGGFYRNEVTTRVTVVLLATFTMLSGYLLGLRPVEPTRASIASFYRRRMLRIYPPLVLAVLCFVLMGLTTWPTAIRTMLLVGEIVGPPPLTLWYVAMLALFYLITPLLSVGSSAARRALVAVAVMLLLAALSGWGGLATDPRIALYFPSFAIGLAVAREPLPPRWMLFASAALGLASIVLTLGQPVPAIERTLLSAPMATLLALALLLLALSLANRVPPSPVLAALGTASFFMYLLHRPIYQALAQHIPFTGPVARTAILVLVALPIVAATSWTAQKAYDALLARLTLA
ncbi:acyltransferase [Kaistia geumhonensis]|uniref:Peptidoglycan/LPS O-acetylase OafA/YrhL n=1 Tax=Kaistia geumhonensis TaxID=410839 RepID=A0ABU0M7F1_9HYPH|nr:acyltransferase [Kaistia geumhonensis]MCX5477893.1 acyltransferase [Kaistia geumhonensis]MDQ0516894.1 peptidoglycan/LPS O-acetylase OafA/YrhL [Kaistia geumhonensis]